MPPLADLSAPEALTKPRRFAIASGKGGVGKTWLAITLAHAWARSGRAVLLVDGDLGLANADIQLNLSPGRDLGHALLGAPLAECCLHVPEAGFSLLPGRSGETALASLPPATLDGLLTSLAALPYADLLIDCGAGIEPTVRRLALSAETVLVVTTDEPTALTDAYALIKVARRDKPGADLRIVINQAASDAAGRRTYDTLARTCDAFLGWRPPLAGIVRADRRVAEAIRAQTPLLRRHPASPAAEDVIRLATALT